MRKQARSSVGERHLDVVDVGVQSRSAPTRYKAKVNDGPIASIPTLAFIFM